VSLPTFFTKNSDETKLTKLSTIAKQLLAFDQPLVLSEIFQCAFMSQCKIAKDRSSVRLSVTRANGSRRWNAFRTSDVSSFLTLNFVVLSWWVHSEQVC